MGGTATSEGAEDVCGTGYTEGNEGSMNGHSESRDDKPRDGITTCAEVTGHPGEIW